MRGLSIHISTAVGVNWHNPHVATTHSALVRHSFLIFSEKKQHLSNVEFN